MLWVGLRRAVNGGYKPEVDKEMMTTAGDWPVTYLIGQGRDLHEHNFSLWPDQAVSEGRRRRRRRCLIQAAMLMHLLCQPSSIFPWAPTILRHPFLHYVLPIFLLLCH